MTTPKSGSDCAFPVIGEDVRYWGLTKREYLAGLAMQGLLANPSVHNSNLTPEGTAIESLQYTDALLAELAKEDGVK